MSVERPSPDELSEILKRTTGSDKPRVEKVMSAEQLVGLQREAARVLAADPIVDYVAKLVCATHPDSEDCPEEVRPFIRYGSSPRGAQALLRLGKARALSLGRDHLALEDITELAKPVFRHRIHLSFEGETEGVTADSLVESILNEVPFDV